MIAPRGNITLTSFEGDLASLCVAGIFGIFGGIIAYTLPYTLAVDILGAIVLGYALPFVVCKYLFKSAHHHYGVKSIKHRIYDATGLGASLLTLWLLTSLCK